ncbi:MAG TPA: TonB-dependent receptor [Puia sp.]|uniref:TonB-dependent receptor plug domain-containing protein n=1 Tax=Puia sp. TaxID=2045100 RepID=UPI002C70F2F5|nr:TonB-dependent receptor [Puia sp.]HVU94004.1 TonB-dependent receptor [Puia sp.]
MKRLPRYFLYLLLPVAGHAQHDTVPEVNRLAGLPLEQLMKIKVVTASGFLQPAAQAPSTVTVITAQQIRERGYEQLEDALRDVPGIDMIHINGYAPTLIYFRGMYGAENLRALLMIDGIAENNIIGSNDMAGPAYSLHDVDRIEIIWGPVSAIYGANAFGGVINMITKKGQEMNGFHAEQGFGSFNTLFEKLNMGVRQGNWEVSASGTLYSSDGPVFANRDPNYSGSYVNKAYGLKGALSYYGGKTVTTLGYREYRTPMGWGTYSNSPTTYLGLPPQGNGNSGVLGILSSDFRGERSGLDDAFLRTLYLRNEWRPSDRLTLSGQIVYRETGTGDDSYVYITTDGVHMIRAKIATRSSRVMGLVTAIYELGGHQKLSGGIQYFRDNVEKGGRGSTYDPTAYVVDGKDTVVNVRSTFLPRVYDIRRNFGSYLQYILETPYLNKTTLTAGVRYDYNSYFGSNVSPRIVVVNEATDKLTFKLQYGHAFRAPTNLEIYQTGRNFKLVTEKIDSYEGNVLYSFSERVSAQVNGFHNDLSDVIILANLSGFNPDKNPGIVHVTGVEAVFNVKPVKEFSAFANFTWQDATGKNLTTGMKGRMPGVARVKGNAGVTAYAADVFSVTLSGNWVGQRISPPTDPYGPVAGYFLTNLVFHTGKIFDKRISASVAVHNLFNVRWLDPGFRTADGFVYSTVLEQPGRNATFKICVTL